MATAVQLRRGTTSEHSTFTGAVGEITVDTTTDTAVVHDGVVAGGFPLLRQDLNNITTVPATKGGTGLASPGTAGNVLVSDGTNWQSTTVSAGFNGAQTVTSATDVTLTASSPQVLNLTMTAENRYVVLPNATTTTEGTPVFLIANIGWIAVNVVTSASTLGVVTIQPGQSVRLSLLNKGTADGIWSVQDLGPSFGLRIGLETIESFGADGVSQITDTTFLLSKVTAETASAISGVTSRTLEHRVATLSGGVLTYGSPVSVTYSGNVLGNNFRNLQDGVLIAGYDAFTGPTTASFRSKALRISGTSIAAGTELTWSNVSSGGGVANYSTFMIQASGNSQAIASDFNADTDVGNPRSGRIRTLTVNGDNSISAGSVVDPGLQQHLQSLPLQVAPGVFIAYMHQDYFYGSTNNAGLRVLTISGTSISLGTTLLGISPALIRLDDNTAINSSRVITRTSTTLTSVALGRNIAISIPVQSSFLFNNVYPDITAGTAQQIIGTAVSQTKSIAFGGVVGGLRFKVASDEFVSFFTGANLRYNRFKVIA